MAKLVIILDEKDPDTKHRCNEEECLFFQMTKDGGMGPLCKTLWGTNSIRSKALMSCLCNYYNTSDINMVEVVDDEELEKFINKLKEK